MSLAPIGPFLQGARERTGLTQREVSGRARPETSLTREYIARIETGRVRIVYPEKFNELCRILGFAGWEGLEKMGYRTDARIDRLNPTVMRALMQLTMEQQEQLLPIIRGMPANDGAVPAR